MMKILYIVTPTLISSQFSDSKTINDLDPFDQKMITQSLAQKIFVYKPRQKRALFDQFQKVRIADVWNEAKSDKVVSYTIARDLTQVCQSYAS